MGRNEFILEINAELHVYDNLSTFAVRVILVVDYKVNVELYVSS